MGDGMGGLAAAIFGAMAFILLGGFALLFWIARGVARARGWSASTARNAGLIGGVAGLALGAIAVTATFFEPVWMPPPRLDLEVPPGYTHEWTFILEDPSAAAKLSWRGPGLPFTQLHAALSIPVSGVVRVQSLGEAAGRGDLQIRWSDGYQSTGSGSGPAPSNLRATLYLAINRQRDPMQPSAMLPYDDALGSLIAEREGRRETAR